MEDAEPHAEEAQEEEEPEQAEDIFSSPEKAKGDSSKSDASDVDDGKGVSPEGNDEEATPQVEEEEEGEGEEEPKRKKVRKKRRREKKPEKEKKRKPKRSGNNLKQIGGKRSERNSKPTGPLVAPVEAKQLTKPDIILVVQESRLEGVRERQNDKLIHVRLPPIITSRLCREAFEVDWGGKFCRELGDKRAEVATGLATAVVGETVLKEQTFRAMKERMEDMRFNTTALRTLRVPPKDEGGPPRLLSNSYLCEWDDGSFSLWAGDKQLAMIDAANPLPANLYDLVPVDLIKPSLGESMDDDEGPRTESTVAWFKSGRVSQSYTARTLHQAKEARDTERMRGILARAHLKNRGTVLVDDRQAAPAGRRTAADVKSTKPVPKISGAYLDDSDQF